MAAKPERRRHILRRLCEQGDAVTAWETGADLDQDAEAQAAVREAEQIFREALGRGDVAFAVEPGQAPRKIERWGGEAEEASEVIITPRLMGG